MSIPAATPVPREAREFGNYQLIAKLATGGMAEIFLARQSGVDGPAGLVVIKRILPHLADDEHFVAMFRDEAALASKLEHEHVGRVHALGQVQGTWFIVMEYLHGIALSRLLSKLSKQRQRVDVRVAAALVIQACEGLHHAHEARGPDGSLLNVVHRDVSPPNIFLTADGVVKLLDFGIAKARGASSKTRTGTVKGKNAYMSPEQILGKPLDRRSDVFALGAVLYELLTVKRLFHRESDFLTFKAITEEPIPDVRERRPDLPLALRAVVTRSLARDVGARFDTAQEMADAIRAAVATLGGPASSEEIARLVAAEFAEELTAKQQLFEQAAAAAIDADSSVVPNLAASSGQHLAVAPTVVDRPPRQHTNDLPAVRGELDAPPRRAGPPPIPGSTPPPVPGLGPPPMPAAMPSVRVDSTVGPLPGPGAGPVPGVGPATPGPMPHPALLIAPLTAETAIPTDINTDLLGARRRGFVIKAVVALGLGAAITLALVLGGGGGKHGDTPVAAATPPDAGVVAIDAAPVVDADPSGLSRDDIAAISKFGYFSIDADAPTTIHIDGVKIGDTPLRRVALSPGPHKVKAVGPKRKEKRIDVTIYGGQDTDWGTISW